MVTDKLIITQELFPNIIPNNNTVTVILKAKTGKENNLMTVNRNV